jgi:hypothetical protein
VVTVTLTVPRPVGEVAEHELAEQNAPVAETTSKATLPLDRFDPVTVTTVPSSWGTLWLSVDTQTSNVTVVL